MPKLIKDVEVDAYAGPQTIYHSFLYIMQLVCYMLLEFALEALQPLIQPGIYQVGRVVPELLHLLLNLFCSLANALHLFSDLL